MIIRDTLLFKLVWQKSAHGIARSGTLTLKLLQEAEVLGRGTLAMFTILSASKECVSPRIPQLADKEIPQITRSFQPVTSESTNHLKEGFVRDLVQWLGVPFSLFLSILLPTSYANESECSHVFTVYIIKSHIYTYIHTYICVSANYYVDVDHKPIMLSTRLSRVIAILFPRFLYIEIRLLCLSIVFRNL